MNKVLGLRLALDCITTGLLLFAFAYYFKGNSAHEWAGIAIFALLLAHGIFNRRWFSNVIANRKSIGNADLLFTAVLLLGMITLFATSAVISETVVPYLRLDEDFFARRIHAAIAYWLMLIVGIHLGLRWKMLMGIAARGFRVRKKAASRTFALRFASGAVALQGFFSFYALDLQSKLLMQMTLDWWNFEENAIAFFAHCIAVLGLTICAAHYLSNYQSGFFRLLLNKKGKQNEDSQTR